VIQEQHRQQYRNGQPENADQSLLYCIQLGFNCRLLKQQIFTFLLIMNSKCH
jgi:hypothetical protein